MRQHLLWAVQKLLLVLAAVNRIYFPSKEFKWMSDLSKRFKIAPIHLDQRLKDLFDSDLEQSWDEIRKLINEN